MIYVHVLQLSCTVLHYNNITLLPLISIGVPVIQAPAEIIYRPNDNPVELRCTITGGGSTGWQINGDHVFTVSTIRGGRLDNHTVTANETNLIVQIPTNNTEYVCVSIRDAGNLFSSPVYLYIAGMCITTLLYVVI